jgi:hypothetical protein
MGFFETPAPPSEPPYPVEPEPRIGGYAPGVVPVEMELGRSDRAVIVLRELLVFPDGIEFSIHTHLSPAATEEYEERLSEQMRILHERSALHGTSSQSVMIRRERPSGSRTTKPSPRPRLPFGLFGFGPFGRDESEPRFGVLLADGTRV